MKVLVIGANGQIGKSLITYMKDHAFITPVAMVRNEEQLAYFEDQGVKAVIGDLERGADRIAQAALGCTAMVFTAGSGPHTGPDKTLLVDLDGAVKSMEAARTIGMKRYVMVSSFDTTREAIQESSRDFAPYVVAKHYADDWLRKGKLDWTIVHPGLLTNDSGSGKVKVGTHVGRDEVPREDVAKVLLACLENESTIGKEFQVVRGDVDVTEAIRSL